MGKVKEVIQTFLNKGGYDLCFNEDCLPKIYDMDVVLTHRIKAWEYNGMTKGEWYGS